MPLVHVDRSEQTWNPQNEDPADGRETEAQLANAALSTLASEVVEAASGRLSDIMATVARREREQAERIRRVIRDSGDD